MVQINASEQYDTFSWFAICSVGAVFSLVFTVMGIKWWFRKRITFEHDPVVESIVRPGRSHQDISVATTGIYRQSKDIDSFEVSERPKSLPPVKTKPSGQPFLPVRHTFVDNTQNRPVPEEVIPIPEERIPQSPPSTPISAVRDDFSRPVVVDIDIPGESGYILQTDNELPKPEVHQRLTLNNYDETHVVHEVPIPMARKKSSMTPPVEETFAIKPLEKEENVEIIANSEKLNEFEAFIEQERKEMENIRKLKRLESVEIIEENHPAVVKEQKVEIVKKEEEIYVQIEEKEKSSVKIVDEEIKQEEVTLVQEEPLPEKQKLPYLNLEEPLDASNIISPKPRMRKGILKKKAPPIPIVKDEEETKVDENYEQQVGIIRWGDDEALNESSTDDFEPNVKKGVKFDHNEPDIIPSDKQNEKQSVKDIIKEIEEVSRDYDEETEVSEKIEEVEKLEEEKPGFVQVIEINKSEDKIEENQDAFKQIIKIESFDEEVVQEVVHKDFVETKAVASTVLEEKEEVVVTMPLQDDLLESPKLVKAEMAKNYFEIAKTTKTEVLVQEAEEIKVIKYNPAIETETEKEIDVFEDAQSEFPEYMEIKTVEEEKLVKIDPVEPENPSENKFNEVQAILVTNDEKEEDLQPTLVTIDKSEEFIQPILFEKVEEQKVEIKEETLTKEIEFVETKNEVILNQQETNKKSEDISSSKEPVPTPRKMVRIVDENLHIDINVKEKEVIQPSSDSWEPQTVVHNNQVMVLTPPPDYPPPTLPNSYLSDDSEESVSSDDYDENNPPNPPKRYRIYVVNNSDGETSTKVKPILKTRPPVKRVSFDNAEPDVFLRSPDMPDYKDNAETEGGTSPLMPNLLTDMSPRFRKTAFEQFKDEEKEGNETEEKVEEVKKDDLVQENLVNGQEKEETPIEVTKVAETPKPEPEKPEKVKTANLIEVDDTPPIIQAVPDIQSPLEEKVAYFKLLADKLNDSPVKSPERQFADLLTPEPSFNKPIFNKQVPATPDDKPKIIEVQEKSPKNVTIVRQKPEQAIPRPTSLLLNNAKASLTDVKLRKPPQRQLSEPALLPRDALMAQIRSFGENKKLKSATTGIKVDIEEALI